MKNLHKKLLSFLLVWCFVSLAFSGVVYASDVDVVIVLYENDVHCAIEGYSKLAAMKNELLESYAHVGVVSCGDFVQGSSLATVSAGGYMVELMNLVGYDAIALGNHEFDYRLDRLNELVSVLDTKPICCNFQKIGLDTSCFEPYSIVSYGGIDIAYIGITTPNTLTSSAPSQFKDENGDYLYTFNTETLAVVVQNSIDAARAEGADYIVALSHIGYEEDPQYSDIVDLIADIRGLDVVLDGHSHTVIENMKLIDADGNEVILSSTGSKFEHIGKMVIADGEITTELIKTENYTKTDTALNAYIDEIYAEYSILGEREIAKSEVDLITHGEDGSFLVRIGETNLGNLCADAFRMVTGADIGCINGGGIRAPLSKGNITFNDMLNIYPYNNTVAVVEISGRVLRDYLEMALKFWPSPDGSFPHISGVTFSVNTAIESAAQMDENWVFTGISGPYRVYNIKVLNKESGRYESLDLDKQYTIASHNYLLLQCGGGMSMFAGAKILQNDGMLDVELLEKYIVENLGGVIGQEHANVRANITFTDGEISNEPIPPTGDDSRVGVWVFVFLGCLGGTAVLLNRKSKAVAMWRK